jgi:hypothetical protein
MAKKKQKKVAKKTSAKKRVAKKAAARKSAPKKAAAKKKPAAKAKKASGTTAAAPAVAVAVAWTEFPPVLEELVEWVNGGKAGEVDFEMYESFNEQYKPSDWTRNPASDSEFFTFGMDGTGGQVALWRKDPKADAVAQPVVFLGSEGEVKPLATSLPGFLKLLASGLGPLEVTSGGEPSVNAEMLSWVNSSFPDSQLGETAAILDEAASTLSNFEQYIRSHVKE